MKRLKEHTLVKFFAALPPWVVWGFALPLIVLNGWVFIILLNYFRTLVTVFVTAMLLAFVLGYPVRLLQHFRVQRTRAILLVLLLTIALIVILGVTLIPLLIEQVNELANNIPVWIHSGNQQLQALQTWANDRRLPIDVSKLTLQLEERISTQLQAISGAILTFLLNAIGSVLNLVLTLVLTFYLLLHGDRLWDGIFQWFPRRMGVRIRYAFHQNFQNYFLGQATLAVLMGSAITLAFLVLQIPFGLLFGLGVGILALFPFGAAFGITLVSLLMALQSIWLGLKVLVVATVIDQLIENGIAPQLIGGFTGLNPVWILVSLLVGAKIGGLLGLVVAVPFASSIKSIADTLSAPRRRLSSGAENHPVK
jgi:predicted PurR-regulated permease PerM